MNPLEQRIEWMARRFLLDRIDYGNAVILLFGRIGYTELYARVLSRLDAGYVHSKDLFASAAQHALTPRIFFPDKAALDDTKLTSALLGVRIPDMDTSMGVGFVAEANVGFRVL